MIDMKEIQKRVYQNKLNHGFNATDVPLEFSLTCGGLSKAFEAWRKKKDSAGEELAEILHVNLQAELMRRIEVSERRRHTVEGGVLKRIKEETEEWIADFGL